MFCQLIIAIGLTFGCVEQPPARDLAAEVLIEQEKRHQDSVARALAKRDRFYAKPETCTDCPRLNTLPFPVKE